MDHEEEVVGRGEQEKEPTFKTFSTSNLLGEKLCVAQVGLKRLWPSRIGFTNGILT